MTDYAREIWAKNKRKIEFETGHPLQQYKHAGKHLLYFTCAAGLTKKTYGL